MVYQALFERVDAAWIVSSERTFNDDHNKSKGKIRKARTFFNFVDPRGVPSVLGEAVKRGVVKEARPRPGMNPGEFYTLRYPTAWCDPNHTNRR